MKKYKNTIYLVLFIAVCLAIVLNIRTVLGVFPWLWHVFEVLVIGGCIAFLVNIIMDFFSHKVFTPDRILNDKLRKTLNLLVSLLVIVLVLVLVTLIIIPQLFDTFRLLFERLPSALDEIRVFLEDHTRFSASLQNLLSELKTHADSISSSTSDIIKSTLPKTFSAASTGVHSVMNFFIALIFAIYILLSKNFLMENGRKLCYAYLPKKWANEVLYIIHLTSRNFKDFIYGRFVDALSMAVLYLIGALIFRIPDALMITTMIAVFCLIPLFGALIAWIIGVILIITVSPIKAIIFTVLIVVIMLFARNVIYPRVIGTSIGLPDIWVLAAIIVGGKMLGLMGMIVAVPVFGVIYSLFKTNEEKRISSREIAEAEYSNQPNWKEYDPKSMEFKNEIKQNKNNKD